MNAMREFDKWMQRAGKADLDPLTVWRASWECRAECERKEKLSRAGNLDKSNERKERDA